MYCCGGQLVCPSRLDIGLQSALLICLVIYETVAIEPAFDVPQVNVTVTEGHDAMLPCLIRDLGNHKVAWSYGDLSLTYDDRRIVDDSRFSIVRNYAQVWDLQVESVTWNDQGAYRCIVNTKPPRSKIIMLHVKVPPKIIDELSSNDVVVQEGESVVLVCNVTGVPRPKVTWSRWLGPMHEVESKDCNLQGRNGPDLGSDGEMVIIQNISRYCDGIYQCVADNGVPNSVSRKIRVTVEFPPEVEIKVDAIYQSIGKDTILDCRISAYPLTENYWEKDGRRVSSTARHFLEAYTEEPTVITLSLQIHNVQEYDLGVYRCVSKNEFGEDSKTMALREKILEYPVVPLPSIRTVTSSYTTRVTPRIEKTSGGAGYKVDKSMPKSDFSSSSRSSPTAYSVSVLITSSVILHLFHHERGLNY